MVEKLLAIGGALAVIGAATAAALYWAFPVRMSILAGLTRNCVRSWSAPRGTASIQSYPAYHSAAVLALSPVAEALPAASVGDWPSYNRTLSSERWADLSEIRQTTIAKLSCLVSTALPRAGEEPN